jgi:hypothetical protein
MATRRTALTVTQLQEQIFAREGFRVSFERLGKSDAPLPPYAYPVMAPTGWKVSDWQRVRLAPYVLLFRGVTVYRGDDTPIPRDVKLGHLRDSYYEATYGTLEPEPPRNNVLPFDTAKARSRKRSE